MLFLIFEKNRVNRTFRSGKFEDGCCLIKKKSILMNSVILFLAFMDKKIKQNVS